MTSNLKGLSSNAIRGEFFKTLEEAQAAAWSSLVAMMLRSNQEIEPYKWLGDAPVLREKASNNTKTTLKASGLNVTNKRFSAILEIDDDDFRRDKTDQIMTRTRDLAKRAAQLPQQVISRLLIANSNAYDGAAFFHASGHVTPNGDTVNNAISYNATSSSTLTVAEGQDVILQAITQILGFKDDVGEPRNEFAQQFLVMCPVGLWTGLLGAVKNDYTSNGASNTIKGSGFGITVVMNPRLTAADKCFVFRTDSDVKAFLWQDEVDPQFDNRTPQNSDEGFKNDVHLYKAQRIGNGAFGRFDQACQVTIT